MMDEPTSLLGLGLALVLTAERMWQGWLTHRERKRNGGVARNDRGALGNGPKALATRLDGIDATLEEAKRSREKLHDELKKVDRRVAHIEGRLNAGGG